MRKRPRRARDMKLWSHVHRAPPERGRPTDFLETIPGRQPKPCGDPACLGWWQWNTKKKPFPDPNQAREDKS